MLVLIWHLWWRQHFYELKRARSFRHIFACRGFKALKQIVKLHFKLQEREAMLAAYRCSVAISNMAHRMTRICCEHTPSCSGVF